MTAGPATPAWDEVVSGAMNGDREAIEALWQEHRRWIAAVLLAHKSSEDQLDDLLQEVAMTVVSKIGTLRETRKVRAWLRIVAVNTARASARAGRARPKPAAPGREPATTCRRDTGGPGGLDDEARRMLELSRRLPEAYREPLMLRAIRGLRGRHIAEILQLSEATVETRIARARRMLRELAGAGQDGGAPSGPITAGAHGETRHETAT